MSCKQLFRQMRAAEFAVIGQGAQPMVIAFFRREFDGTLAINSPWSPPVDLSDLLDRQRAIDHGVPEHPQIVAMQMLQDRMKYGPGSAVAH